MLWLLPISEQRLLSERENPGQLLKLPVHDKVQPSPFGCVTSSLRPSHRGLEERAKIKKSGSGNRGGVVCGSGLSAKIKLFNTRNVPYLCLHFDEGGTTSAHPGTPVSDLNTEAPNGNSEEEMTSLNCTANRD